MTINIISPGEKSKYNFFCFAKTVYNNFKYLERYSNLKHNMTEIIRIIKSPNSIIIFKINNKKIVGYVLGEIIKLNDGRNIFYITYIFTSRQFRLQGIASELLNVVFKIVSDKGLDCVMLTYDSDDVHLKNFYEKKGFMPDVILRTYDKFEVLSK